MPLIPRTRDDRRARALIVRPRGTQRILRPERARPRDDVKQFQGGSRSVLPVGFATGGGGLGPGGRGGGAGAQAAIARALAGAAIPAAVGQPGPDVFGQPEPVTPFAPPSPDPFAPQQPGGLVGGSPLPGDPGRFVSGGTVIGTPTVAPPPTAEQLAFLQLLLRGSGF